MMDYGGWIIEEGVAASANNTLRYLHISSVDTKAESNNCLVIPQKHAKTCLPPSMLISTLAVQVYPQV